MRANRTIACALIDSIEKKFVAATLVHELRTCLFEMWEADEKHEKLVNDNTANLREQIYNLERINEARGTKIKELEAKLMAETFKQQDFQAEKDRAARAEARLADEVLAAIINTRATFARQINTVDWVKVVIGEFRLTTTANAAYYEEVRRVHAWFTLPEAEAIIAHLEKGELILAVKLLRSTLAMTLVNARYTLARLEPWVNHFKIGQARKKAATQPATPTNKQA